MKENREIKFRAYRDYGASASTKMIYSDAGFILSEYLNTEHPIMQFTGLKDKNGVEIYEGDIVNEFGFIKQGIVKFGQYGQKNFSNNDRQVEHLGWYIEPISNFDERTQIEWNQDIESLVNSQNGLEVIGNIYENEELLE